MQNRFHVIFCLLLLSCQVITFSGWAQQPTRSDTVVKDDLKIKHNTFQDLFFDALAQRAIANYDKSTALLKQAEQDGEHRAVIWFVIGKNYSALHNYQRAETYLKKALTQRPQQPEVVLSLYKVYHNTKNYKAAIPLVKNLAQEQPRYYKDLSDLYRLNGAYVQALKALKMYTQENAYPETAQWRQEIIKSAAKNSSVEQYLKVQLEIYPQVYSGYEDLIYYDLISEKLQEALRIAERLDQLDPGTAQLPLVRYKLYLQEKKYDRAVVAITAFVKHSEAENTLKIAALKAFQHLLKTHPEYRDEFVKLLGEESSGGHPNNRQLGEYYIGKDNTQAIEHLEKALAETPQDLSTIRALAVLYHRTQKYEKLLKLAEDKLSIYPAQAGLYLFKGQAQNGLKQYSAAKMSLVIGIDFVVEEPELKRQFYKALAESSLGLGEQAQAKTYTKKAANLKSE